ncbi:solute carrier family 15 member 1-like [Periplaneta americana]|uniref:solute carrier family 15 member 1-like n=1 Tax=Periplaneta americana TaxID=6978 RepID=UPI0037E8CA27
MLCYFVPIFGAMLADSFLGKYRTILYFSCIYAVGNILLCIAAAPPVSLPPVTCTLLGLILIAAGTGGIKPCVAAFGGDQFHLPQQEERLNQFFSIFYFTINFGGLIGMIMTPILRTAFACFGNDSCYALGFGFPAALMVLAFLLFIMGRSLYRMKAPKENVVLQFIQCACYAVTAKCRSRVRNKDHWLDYASDKFNSKLISDMKVVLSILFLFIPLPLFWSLFDQQGSRWTFQASRMVGKVLSVELLPDQIQVINPAIVLLLIPFFHKTLYPLMDKCHFMSSPLKKMIIGGFIAGFAFVASAVLELKLEDTYPVLPDAGESQLNFVNLLPCEVHILNPFNRLQTINATNNFVFRNVAAKNRTKYQITLFTSRQCDDVQLEVNSLRMEVVATEFQVDTFLICIDNNNLKVFSSEPEELTKSLSGKPRVRIVFLRSIDIFVNTTVALRNTYGVNDVYFVPEKTLGVSRYMELDAGRYKYSISLLNASVPDYQQDVHLEVGAVYSLVIQEVTGNIVFSKLFVMTPPNRIHMLWLVPQYILISVGEVMFAISGLQFSFLQAPKSMKTVTIAAWYLSVSLGNLLVIIITQVRVFRSQAYEFFLFAGLIFVDMTLFAMMCTGYNYVNLEADGSSSVMQCEESQPLLEAAGK